MERISLVAIVESYRILAESKRLNIHLVFLIFAKFGFSSFGAKYISLLSTENPWGKIVNKVVIALIFAVISKIVFNQSCKTDENEDEAKKKRI